MNSRIEIGAIVRNTRKKMKLNQVTLARELRVSQAAISKIENGILEPSMTDFLNLWALARSRGAGALIRRYLDSRGLK